MRTPPNRISRREFVTLATVGAVASRTTLYSRLVLPQVSITAQAVVDRIKQKIGVDWKTETVDTFKAGDPSAVVRGIAVSAMPTMDVLRQAVKGGANLLITGEPAFYSKSDSASPPAGRGGATGAVDPIFAAKNEFIRKEGLILWRFSDHWRGRKPDPLAIGLTDALGWSTLRAANDPSRITMPAITLDTLASDLKRKLNSRGGIRVIGDSQLRVQKIGLLPGTTAIQAALTLLPGVDAIIAGEVREWETVEYVRDKITAGEKKSLILLGRVVSEDPGMNVCAQWVQTIVPEVPTAWIPAGDPYWRPV
jgi:putative NIF3 family GTP cyclohydrolase 1 type 2